MKNNIQRYLIYALFLSLPFERLLTFELSGFTIKLSYIFAVLLITYFLFNIKLLPREKVAPYEWALLFFWLISFTTVFWSPDKFLTLALNLVILLSFVTFFILRRVFSAVKSEMVIKIIVWLAVLTSLFAFWQFVGDLSGWSQQITGLANLYVKNVFGFPRVQSTFFEPSFFANFLLVPLYLSAYSVIKNRKVWDFATLIIIGTAFFLTLSRGGLISLAVSLVFGMVLILKWHKKYQKNIWNVFITLIVAFLISICAIYLGAGANGVERYFGQAKNSTDLVSGEKSDEFNPTRGYTVRVALKNSLTHPFGVGTGAFGTLPEFTSVREVAGNQRQTVNSIYPETLVETGFLGLIAFLTFVYLFLRDLTLRSKKSVLITSLAVATIAIFIQFLSFSTYYLVYIWVFLAFATSRSATNIIKA